MEDNNIQKEKETYKKVLKNLDLIFEKEPDLAEALSGAIDQIAGSYGDKYGSGGSTIKTKPDLYHPEYGHHINLYQTKRYLQRYDTAGFNKSQNPVDLRKAVHYIVFELTRLVKKGKTEGEDKIN